LYSKTGQYHSLNHKPDKESKKIASKDKRQKKRNAKKYQQSGWIFFSKIVKQTGSNNCEQGGKNFKIVKRSCSLNRYYRVTDFVLLGFNPKTKVI
jgi:hypothetical protein